MFHRQYNISLLSYTVSKVRASYILSKICSCLELIQVTFSNFFIKLRHAPLAIKRGIYRLRRWWIFSVLFVVVQFLECTGISERIALKNEKSSLTVLGSQWCVWEPVGLLWISNCYNVAKLSVHLVDSSGKTKMSVIEEAMFSNSWKSYGDFDRILPISGNDYFVSVNILCPLRTEQMQYLYNMGFLLFRTGSFLK